MKRLLCLLTMVVLMFTLPMALATARFSAIHSFEHSRIALNEFSEIQNDTLYTPKIEFANNTNDKNNVVIHWYELYTNRTGVITIESNTIGFPVIKLINDKILHVDYIDHAIKVYNLGGELLKTLLIENDYPDNVYPGQNMPIAVVDNEQIIINNIFSESAENIQIYSLLTGEQLGKFSKFLRVTPSQNIVYSNDTIYCFYSGSIEMFDILGNKKDSIRLMNDEFNQYSQFVGGDTYFAVIGSNFLSMYDRDFSSHTSIALDNLLGEDVSGKKLDINVKNLKLISADNYLYLLNLQNNRVFRLGM